MDTVFTSRNKIRLILLALVMAILVGLGAIVLHDLFDFLWEDILHTVPALQRSGIVLVSGLLSALGWYFLQRQGRRLIPLKKQISPQSEIEALCQLKWVDEKLTPREDELRSLFLYVQSNQNPFFKVFKVPESKGISLNDFDEIVGSFQFGVGIRQFHGV